MNDFEKELPKEFFAELSDADKELIITASIPASENQPTLILSNDRIIGQWVRHISITHYIPLNLLVRKKINQYARMRTANVNKILL